MLGVSETTIKSYRRKFPGCIPVANKGKPIRFTLEAKDICTKIRDFFALGMSVEEVGKRLSGEYGWKKPQGESSRKKNSPGKDHYETAAVQAGDECSSHIQAALGNMAKSMVVMTRRQEELLATMRGIEGLLREMGLKGVEFPDLKAVMKARSEREASEQDAFNKLRDVAKTMREVVERSQQVLNDNKAINAILLKERKMLVEGSEKIVSLASSFGGQGINEESNALTSGKIINLHEHSLSAGKMQQPAPVPFQADVSEVPRSMLTLPIVLKLEDGTFISAGGKNVGKVSINDIKAMLAQEYLPPDNYYLRWERNMEGWWAIFEQPTNEDFENGLVVKVLLHEISSAKGFSVLEAKKMVYNNEPAPPAEFSNFITGIGR